MVIIRSYKTYYNFSEAVEREEGDAFLWRLGLEAFLSPTTIKMRTREE
jgi:hypothetical protein